MVAQMTSILTVIDTMCSAIDEELATQNSNKRNITVKNGQIVQLGNLFNIYRFEMDTVEDLNDEQTIDLVNGSKKICGSIVTTSGTLITLSFQESLPDSALVEAQIHIDQAYLLRELKRVLQENRENTQTIIGKQLLRLTSTHDSHAAIPIHFGPHFVPYPTQKLAIERMLGSEVTFIVGPPGTGKTTTLAATALAFLCQGKTVLIAAHTNIAVDNAIEKLELRCNEAGKSDFITSDAIVRFGNTQVDSVRQNEHLYAPLIAERRGKQLSQERDKLTVTMNTVNVQIHQLQTTFEEQQIELQRELRAIEPKLATANADYANRMQVRREQQQFHSQQLEEILRQKSYLVQSISRYEGVCTELQKQLQNHQQLIKNVAEELAEILALRSQIETRTGIHQWLSRSKLTQLIQQGEQLREQYIFLEAEIRVIQQHYSENIQPLQYSKNALDQLIPIIHQLESKTFPVSKEEHLLQEQIHELQKRHQFLTTQLTLFNQPLFEIEGLRQQIDKLENQISVIDEKLSEIQQKVMQEAKVVCTTLTKVYMTKALLARKFDVVILDEVSMALLPTVFLAACCAKTTVALFGDPMQLGPIIKQNTPGPFSQQWLVSIFDYWKITISDLPTHSVLLDEQARMHPDISSIVRDRVYKGKLKDSLRVAKMLTEYDPLPGQALILCDTKLAEPVAIRPGKSRINIYHALCDIALAQNVLDNLPSEVLKEEKQVIGIVTPYAKQAAFVGQLIKSAGLQHLVRVGTVHRFQGLEFETIIFDATDSGSIDMRPEFIGTGLSAKRLINVALTRACHKLLIVANSAYLEQQLAKGKIGNDSLLLHAVRTAMTRTTIDATQLLPEIEVNDLTKHQIPHSITINQLGATTLNEDTFYPALLKDIREATSSINICSPFVGKRVDLYYPHEQTTLIDEILAAKNRGVNCTIYTKPNEKKQDIMDKLTEVCTVSMCEAMHQKCVTIDENIVYLGSLNTLSHWNTNELMHRIQGKG